MSKKNIFYAQSGGVTAVINASAAGVIQSAREHSDFFGNVYAGANGILGALNNQLIDTAQLSDQEVQQLKYTPGGAFGSCRYKLKDLETHQAEYEQLIKVFKARDIQVFMYNGGGDSQDTAHKVSMMADQLNHPIQCIGIPKTIDNDLALTDNCPGFGSVAKYVAISTLEASLDVASMAQTSTKVFILEVMGRHTGWIAASSILARENGGMAPHIILCPERKLDIEAFKQKVNTTIDLYGYCVVVAAEGVQNLEGEFLAETSGKDAFGHAQLGGVAPILANIVKSECGHKVHWAVSDYLQRSARHIASKTDVDQAFSLGKAAVEAAMKGETGVMMTIERIQQNPYQWQIGRAPLEDVANIEKMLPESMFTPCGMDIAQSAADYFLPLIQGNSEPEFLNGLPNYFHKKLEIS